MKGTRVLFALTVINVGLVLYQGLHSGSADAETNPGVLRGRVFEIVDGQGRKRAELKVEPAGKMPDGQSYPETVIFRLITPDGKPRVKLTTSEQGSGLLLLGDSDATYARLSGQGADSTLKLLNKDGRQQLVKP